MGGSATTVASLCMTANYAKTNSYGGGSVYSAVTFMDKLVSGAIVVIVQHMYALGDLVTSSDLAFSR